MTPETNKVEFSDEQIDVIIAALKDTLAILDEKAEEAGDEVGQPFLAEKLTVAAVASNLAMYMPVGPGRRILQESKAVQSVGNGLRAVLANMAKRLNEEHEKDPTKKPGDGLRDWLTR